MGLFGTVDSYDNKGPVGGATNPLTGTALARDRENQRAILELDGTQAYENITILDGSISPKRAEIIVDTEDGASADTLETILTNTDGSTTLHDGMKLTLRSADPSRSVTVKHSNSEFGIQMVDGQDVVLGTKWGLKLKLIANKWFEVQGRIDPATTTSRGIARVATLADMYPDAVVGEGPAFLAAGSDVVTPAPIANTIMCRDEEGRVRVEDPVHDKDVVNKGYFEASKHDLGEMMFTGFTVEELPAWKPGWYFMNGDYFPNDTPQAVQLNAFPDGFKERWGIINNGSATCVPNFFYEDGRGYFVRAADGAARLIGSVEGDAIRNIVGSLHTTDLRTYSGGVTEGVIAHAAYPNANVGQVGDAGYSITGIYINASRAVPTAEDNRPLNIGMTPIIYLGV